MIRPEIKVIKMETVSALASSETPPPQAKGVTLGTLGYANGGGSILY